MKALQEYKEMVNKCSKCGNCQYYCPTFKVAKTEPMVTRGRLELIAAALDGRISEYSELFLKRMNQCLLCGNCSKFCPPGVEAEKIIAAMRTAYMEEKGADGPLAVVKGRVNTVGNITGDAPENRLLWLENMPAKPEGIKVNQPAEYAYLAGCVPTLYPSSYSIPQTFITLLSKAGVDFTLLGAEEICCGYPVLMGGLPEAAGEAARKNVEKLRALGIKKIVTTCPSCYHMWKEYYPELLAEELSYEVVHGSELLAKLLADEKLKPKEKKVVITYHDPCDLGRKSGIYEAPREVLKRIPGVEFKEMKYKKDDSRCCGGGGNLEMSDADLSGKVAQNRVKQALNTGAEVIVTTCQQCKRTLQGGARQLRARIKVMELSEILKEALED